MRIRTRFSSICRARRGKCNNRLRTYPADTCHSAADLGVQAAYLGIGNGGRGFPWECQIYTCVSFVTRRRLLSSLTHSLLHTGTTRVRKRFLSPLNRVSSRRNGVMRLSTGMASSGGYQTFNGAIRTRLVCRESSSAVQAHDQNAKH